MIASLMSICLYAQYQLAAAPLPDGDMNGSVQLWDHFVARPLAMQITENVVYIRSIYLYNTIHNYVLRTE